VLSYSRSYLQVSHGCCARLIRKKDALRVIISIQSSINRHRCAACLQRACGMYFSLATFWAIEEHLVLGRQANLRQPPIRAQEQCEKCARYNHFQRTIERRRSALGSAPLVISLAGKRKGNREFLFFQKLTKGERKGSIFAGKLTMGKRKGFFSGKID
jgi:hypothetical protein